MARLRKPSLYIHIRRGIWSRMPGTSDLDTLLRPIQLCDWRPTQHILLLGDSGGGMHIG